ncbi:MAG: DUF6411 family protein [Thermoleophilaceae bacterium]
MTIALIVVVCVVLLVLAFLLPRFMAPQRGVDRTLGVGQRAGGKAPGPIGRLFSKPFSSSRRATNKSASVGRRGRGKMPL